LIGTVLGAALAFARASRRRGFDDRLQPAAVYDAPLIGEIPAFGTKKILSSGSGSAGSVPMTADPHSAVAEAFRFTAGSVERIRAARGSRLSLVFVSTTAGAGTSAVAANVALALAERGTSVLAVDADAADGFLTALLLPDSPTADGFEQVLAGQAAAADCIQTSPLHEGVAVIRSGQTTPGRATGAAYSEAVEKMLADARTRFDVVLINSPALLRVADATELVDASDATIIVVGPGEPIRDHFDLVDRLRLIESEVVGYIYKRAPRRPHVALSDRFTARPARSARPTGSQTVRPAASFEGVRPMDGESPRVPRARR
jgi:Mrp family chromosome partitioning ATPase